MKAALPFLLFLSFLFGSSSARAVDCSITNLTAEFSLCEQGHYNVFLNFNVQNPVSDSFKVYISGVLQGIFAYSQAPVIIHDYSSNLQNLAIKVQDSQNGDCRQTIEVPAPVCDPVGVCDISELQATFSDCDPEGHFDIHIDFEVEHPVSASFKLWLSQVYIGTYPYSQLPITISNYSTNLAHIAIKVADAEELACNQVIEPAAPDCAPNNVCAINELHGTFSDCDSLGHFDITINFVVENPVSDSFKLWLGQEYVGKYGYNQLPLVIQDYSTSANHVRIKVADSENLECNQIIEPEAPNCAGNGDCAISELHAEFLDCDPAGTFGVVINFDVQNPISDSFKVYIGGAVYGPYAYASRPVTITGLQSNWPHISIKVADAANLNCYKIREFETPDCNAEDCHIYDLSVQFGDCQNGQSVYDLTIDFNYDNVQNSLFDLKLNHLYYGTYSFSALPLVIQSYSNTVNPLNVKVSENDNAECYAEHNFEVPNCAGIVIYGLRAYPNPGTDKLYLATESDPNNFSNPNTWLLYYGVKNVKAPVRKVEGNEVTFDMSGYPVGLYTLCYQVNGEWKSIHWMKM